jgi:hypothetical protein
MATTGTAILDFGDFAASNSTYSHPLTEATVTITGQGSITANSFVEAWIRAEPSGSADHSMDEHFVENIRVIAGNISAGVGFEIRGECLLGGTYGAFTVNWVWT